jgi:hypothetical protein
MVVLAVVVVLALMELEIYLGVLVQQDRVTLVV